MKTFSISTNVESPFETVWKGFDEKLFLALQPDFPETEILRFDGCEPGDKVETNIKFFGIKQPFYSVITERVEEPNMAYFIDKGTKFPFFLSYWQHKHIVKRLTANTSQVTDEITFGSYNAVAEVFLYPVIYGQLWARKSVYRKYFLPKEKPGS